MTQLVPCPGCQRHVRQHESSCPFCSVALSLANVPAPLLPRSRLGRAATFAFGATLVGATALVGCGGDSEEGGGESDAGESSGGSTIGPVYGAPAGGTMNTGGTTSTGGTPSTGGADATGGKPSTGGNSNVGGSAGPVYGSPPSGGSQNIGGTGNFPVYGAAPAD